jgi:lipid-binding SYLF domain-containing protein
MISTILSLCLLVTLSYAESAADQKKTINNESQETLTMLYKAYPSSKNDIKQAYGYATFSNVGVNLVFFSAEGGSGVAVNSKTGKKTYMKMASGGVGIGLGVKDFRAIFVFDNKDVLESFVNSGWEANAQADAAAKSDSKGGALEGAITVQPGMRLYKLTKNGLALQATIQGTKYWKDGDLN